jgi:hypothetical protein
VIKNTGEKMGNMMEWEKKPERHRCCADSERWECWVVTLSALSELVAYNGGSVLYEIYQGYFDEADMREEGIPAAYRRYVKLELLANDFFGILIDALDEKRDPRRGHRRLVAYIDRREPSEEEGFAMLLQYLALRMIRERSLPWEIEYTLRHVMRQLIPMREIRQNYMRRQDTAAACEERYRRHWTDR